jgi:hypothetical protein
LGRSLNMLENGFYVYHTDAVYQNTVHDDWRVCVEIELWSRIGIKVNLKFVIKRETRNVPWQRWKAISICDEIYIKSQKFTRRDFK